VERFSEREWQALTHNPNGKLSASPTAKTEGNSVPRPRTATVVSCPIARSPKIVSTQQLALFECLDVVLTCTFGFDLNTAVGVFALTANTTGELNTAVGASSDVFNPGTSAALGKNTTGLFNTAIGSGELNNNTTGGSNTAVGINAGENVLTASHVICIGADVGGADVPNSCFIGSIRGQTTINNDAIPVLIDSAGQLGTASSSRRFKTDIKPIDNTSESILALKPVSFRYKIHKDTTPNFGLIAEDVAKVNPDLVIYDADRKPYTVRYDAVNAMLLNEFLKEHRTVQEQGAAITRLEKQIETLTAGLQKVSAQLELNKAAPQTVLNNQ